jgi:hypothetical protein
MSIIDQAAQNAANKRKAAELDKIDNKVAMDGLAGKVAAEKDAQYQAQRIAEANANRVALQQEAARIAKEGMFSNNYARPSTTNEYDVRAYINRGGSPTGTVDYGNDPDTQARLREFNANKQRYGSISEGIR